MEKTKTDKKPMNIYQKLQEARVKLLESDLKKTGKNKHLNFDYFELSDILPSINRINKELGLFTSFSITQIEGIENAILIVFDSSGDGSIMFKVPTAEVSSSQPIQGQGAKITYMRRYLMLIAYEISENDVVEQETSKDTVKITKAEIEAIQAVETQEQLIEVCKGLKTKYGQEAILPYYNSKKVDLEQKEAK